MSAQDFAREFWRYHFAIEKEQERAALEFDLEAEDPPERDDWEEEFNRRLQFGRLDPKTAPEQAEKIAAEGGLPASIARALGIDEASLASWCDALPPLRWAIERGYATFRDSQPPRKRPTCPRCGGWVEMDLERTKDAPMDHLIPRCMICGGRFYRGVTVIHVGKSKPKRWGVRW